MTRRVGKTRTVKRNEARSVESFQPVSIHQQLRLSATRSLWGTERVLVWKAPQLLSTIPAAYLMRQTIVFRLGPDAEVGRVASTVFLWSSETLAPLQRRMTPRLLVTRNR